MRKKQSIEWSERENVVANARKRLAPLLTDYFAAGREAAKPDTPSRDLHRFRLRTKRVRYTLELFGDCYGPGLEQRLEKLREIQNRLGTLNDFDTARQLLLKAAAKASPQRARIERFLAERAKEERAKFYDYWRDTFDPPGQEQRWIDYLARNTLPASRKRRSRKSGTAKK
jgi:CHAD domain-containing protein